MDMGRREKRVRYIERVTWKLTLPYVKWIANRNSLYGSGNSNRGCVEWEGWDAVGDGREVLTGGDMCIPMTDSWSRFDRKQQNYVKQLSFN